MSDADQKYEIKILNWEKYQREMKGGENRRRRREWVAISSRIFSDPDFLRLTIEQRYLWLMLVCYAGGVGPEFKLSPSDARVLFKLRRNAVFQPLADQGFIDLRTATNSTNITNNTSPTEKAQGPSIRDRLWEMGPQVLGNGKTDRSFLGRLIKTHGEGTVLAALEATRDHGTGDPKAYVSGILREQSTPVATGFGAFDD